MVKEVLEEFAGSKMQSFPEILTSDLYHLIDQKINKKSEQFIGEYVFYELLSRSDSPYAKQYKRGIFILLKEKVTE